jgi:hypothetical protein
LTEISGLIAFSLQGFDPLQLFAIADPVPLVEKFWRLLGRIRIKIVAQD